MYQDMIMDNNIDEVTDRRIQTLKEIEKDKAGVTCYNRKVKCKSFQMLEINLVWKTILPLGTKISKYGKWSPS